jgi:hypothetical protein
MTTASLTLLQELTLDSFAQPEHIQNDGAAAWHRVALKSDPENPVDVYGRLKLTDGWMTIMRGNQMVWYAPESNVLLGTIPADQS